MTYWIYALAVVTASGGTDTPVRLACQGSTSVITMTTGTAQINQGPGAGASVNTQQFSRGAGGGVVLVDLSETEGRINIPRSLVPALAKRGDDGWYRFDKLETTDDTVRGQFTLSPINKPRMTIDRRTGAIRVKVMAQGFEGICQRVDSKPLF